MITVAIDARLRAGQVDGVARFAKGLATALREIPTARLRIVWIAGSDASWLDGRLRDGDEILHNPGIPAGSDDLWQRAGDDPEAVLRLLRSAPDPSGDPRLPRSPVELDGVAIDLVHFLSQDAFLTKLPSIYHPHDLQHAEFPQFFDVASIGWRELAWRTYAARADVVCVGARHIQDAVALHWPEVAGVVHVLPLAALGLDERLHSAVAEAPTTDIDPGAPVVLYPAGLWPHKNHVRLVEAFTRAVGPHSATILVLTGFEPDPTDPVSAAIRVLGVSEQVRCLGRVSDAELARLYAEAAAVVLPSVYEAGSFPLWEANRAGVRVAASDIPGHRSGGQAVDAWFDPFAVDDMARAIERVLAQPTVASPPLPSAPPIAVPSGAEAFVELYEQVAGG